jgi:predicted phage terminase large subunit-like protein
VAANAQDLQAILAEDLMSFIQYAFSVVAPGKEFRPNWHLQAVAHKLAQVARGEVRRLIITMPPRNLKSICASVALPAWVLGHDPTERVVCVSYSDPLSRMHHNDFRALVMDPLYQATFSGMRIDPRKNTEREIMTTRRGRRLATSIEGTVTGIGGNLMVIDDPIKTGEAHSKAARDKVIEAYRSTLITRGDDKPNARTVLVMQRVDAEDLAGYLQEQGGYDVLNLPAIAPENASFELGHGFMHHRKEGEVLHPRHEPRTVLDEIKREMGPLSFSAQYQQAPIPPGGLIIKREWIREAPRPAPDGRSEDLIVSWDIALSETETGDYSACAVLLKRGDKYHVLEMIRGRWPFDELKRRVIDSRRRYNGALVIEDSPISKGLIQSVRENNINAVSVKPTTDKRARTIAQSDLFAGGSITFQAGAPWLADLKAELLAFPNGKHDDQVDALTQGLAYGRELVKYATGTRAKFPPTVIEIRLGHPPLWRRGCAKQPDCPISVRREIGGWK